MADRKAELERKKAKLEQLRAEKKRAEEEKKKGTLAAGGAAVTISPAAKDLRIEADDILKELGISTGDHVAEAAAKVKQELPEDVKPDVAEMPATGRRQISALGISKVTQTSIPPRELVQYSKETQTACLPDEGDAGRGAVVDDVDVLSETNQQPEMKPPEVEPIAKDEVAEAAAEKPPPRVLTEDECRQVLSSQDFVHFFERASRVMERAIAEDADIFTDYMGETGQATPDAGEHLRISRQFDDERWTRHRSVTSLDWSPEFPELLLACYDGNAEAPNEPDGVALVWNLKFKKMSPEYVFHCQSPVVAGCFAPFHPNLVIGGTYSGQVVLWDVRTGRRTPAQRTPLSATGHTHPVYCVDVVGTANAHSLASISTDGRMCFWSLDMLSAPQDSLELQHHQSKSIAATCVSFFAGGSNNFVVGSEDGTAYAGARHGAKVGASGDSFEAHHGLVTGIDCHNVSGPVDLSSYFLTSSMDWTVKLWSVQDQRPVLSLEDNSDYVLDVGWSPVHPAVFAAADCTGRVDVWNLNTDTEVPAASTVVEGGSGVNKCRWNATGTMIAGGDTTGRVHICDVDASLSIPRSDEWTRLVSTIADVRADRADFEEAGRSGMTLSSSFGQSPLR